jgi:two-component system, chemotaxis family, sensor kinase CheA
MSTSGPDRPFADGFMDDYFAEADEHVVAVRRSLLSLESALGSTLPPAALEDLFRSFHSLKGISAMVELREAELLAHHMESCLRAVRQGGLTLTTASFEVLVDGVRLLEHVIAARRRSESMPVIDAMVEKLEALGRTGNEGSRADPPAAAPAPVETSASANGGLWRVTFVPSPQLVERGVKVDTVRARLMQIGEVQSVTPKVLPGGGISFEFDLQTSDETPLAQWRDDGLTYELLPAPVRAASAADDGGSQERPLTDFTLAGSSNVVRVDLARLDDLMRLVGEMVVTRARLEDTLRRVEAHVPFQEWRALQDHNARLERNLRDLREGVMRVRLVPVGEIFRRMPFVVRDLARDSGKRVHLELTGQTTEIDKFLVERMMDPVLHIVRNAISHGIETPEQRLAAGKPADGIIRLGAATAGETVIIEIADDGRGIDVASVARRARSLSLVVPDDGKLDSRALLDIICASGFSTRDEADRVSGRGVGMAVVRDTVEGLGGILAVESKPGRGTTFRLTLPLTLAITDAIISHVGDQVFAVPQTAVREVVEVDANLLHAFERNELMPYRGGTLPMVRLSEMFSIPMETRPRYHAIVVGTGQAAIGLIVDRIAGQREVVVKTITDPLIRVDGVSGATELGDGRVVLILDVAALSRTRRQHARAITGVSA